MIEDEIEISDHEKYEEPPLPSVNGIEEIDVSNLSYDVFFSEFMTKNLPVLITGISNHWECMNWIASTSDNASDNKINFEYLKRKINPTQTIPVANCSKVYFNSHEKIEMRFDEFLTYWQQTPAIDDDSKELLYLKDWHLRNSQPDYHFYKTPSYFASDWLNEYCDEKKSDDYRFVYMGPKGTWTPLHADVFSSYSWSTNIVGIKKWIFFPPHEEDKLRDRLGNLPFDLNEEQCQNLIHENDVRSFEVIQRAGQTLFVPSGWHHQVWNLADTISVNHNWFNGCNIHWIWSALYEKFIEVLREIDDCKDMDNFDEHCQLMLKSDFGLDFKMFLDILELIVKNRTKIVQSNLDIVLNEYKLGKKHAIFDLKAIQRVLQDFCTKCNLEDLRQTSQNIMLKIDEIIN